MAAKVGKEYLMMKKIITKLATLLVLLSTALNLGSCLFAMPIAAENLMDGITPNSPTTPCNLEDYNTPVTDFALRLFAASGSTQMVEMGVSYLSLMAFFYILPGLTNGIQGYFRGMGRMKTTLVNTAIQISVRAAIVYFLVPRIGLRGAAIACAVGWCCMLVNCAFQYRKVNRRYEEEDQC